MKPQSCKAKGRRLQQEIVQQLLQQFPELEPDDIRSISMGANGTDIQLSPAARKVFPYSIEAKYVESLNVWQALKQAQANTKEGTTPLLIFRRNNTPAHVCFSLEAFLQLLGPQANINSQKEQDDGHRTISEDV